MPETLLPVRDPTIRTMLETQRRALMMQVAAIDKALGKDAPPEPPRPLHREEPTAA